MSAPLRSHMNKFDAIAEPLAIAAVNFAGDGYGAGILDCIAILSVMDLHDAVEWLEQYQLRFNSIARGD